MRYRLISALLLVTCFGVAGYAQTPQFRRRSLEHLRTWAGRYPTEGEGKRRVEILKLPEIRQPLLKLLGAKRYQRLLENYFMEVPIDLIEQHLLIRRWNKWSSEQSVVVINVIYDTKDIYVGFVDDKKVEWFGTNGSRKKPAIAYEWCEMPDAQ